MGRSRRELGVVLFEFIDGTNKEVKIHAVANFEMMKLRRTNRKTKLSKKGTVESVVFEDEKYMIDVIKLSVGIQLTKEDLEECVNDLKKDIYDKYFEKKVSAEKKPTSTDTSEPNQDNNLEE